MAGIGEGVTFWDRVTEKLVDPNGNGRLDAKEITGALQYFGDRLVAYQQVFQDKEGGVGLAEGENITSAKVRKMLSSVVADATAVYPNGVEMPSDAQMEEIASYIRESARRATEFKKHGSIVDRIQGAADLVESQIQEKAVVAEAVVDTLREGSGLNKPRIDKPRSARETR